MSSNPFFVFLRFRQAAPAPSKPINPIEARVVGSGTAEKLTLAFPNAPALKEKSPVFNSSNRNSESRNTAVNSNW